MKYKLMHSVWYMVCRPRSVPIMGFPMILDVDVAPCKWKDLSFASDDWDERVTGVGTRRVVNLGPTYRSQELTSESYCLL